MTTMLTDLNTTTTPVVVTPEIEPVILLINMTESRCGSCLRSADPYDTSHQEGYGSGPGCGVTFTHVSSDYASAALEARIKEMRPDLTFLDPRQMAMYR